MWLHESLHYWAQEQPDAEFAVHDGMPLTYGAAAARVARMAGALAELPVGARVAMLSKNSVDLVLLYYAASLAGVVPVPMNYRLAPPEWAYIVNDSGAPLVLAEPDLAASFDRARTDMPGLRRSVVLSGTVGGHAAAGDEWTPVEQWLGDPLGEDVAFERRHHEVMQCYTSGTTGKPKGAVLTQASVFNLLYQWRMCFPFGAGERLLLVVPIYHVGGAFNSFHAVGHGGSMFMMTDFDPAAVVRALDEERITMAFLVPSMIQSCLGVADIEQRRYEQFRLLSYGASPIAEPTLRSALGIFACDFVQSFGMTECPCVTYLSADDHRRALRGEPHLLESTGRAGPGSVVKIVDESGSEVPPGTVGEICGRGPQIMHGYWNLPEATAAALQGGWMHTGDAGYLDAAGYLFVKDRLKDMIVSGAENIYPREVENALFEHPGVADVAVIGVPSDQWGETVKAIVVRTNGTAVTEDELIEHCRTRLAGFKRPRSVDFIDELPRNPSGKVLKRVLREPYWVGHTRYVS
jgi:acyl-CoA synthetase (AMP-forming)/AMP-acid ligase II